MNDSWRELIAKYSGSIDDDGITQYFTSHPYPNAGAAAMGDLSAFMIYDLAGPDSHKFLQGQITQDVSLLDKGQAFIADHCNAKGRIIGTLLAIPVANQHIRLLMPRDNAQRLCEHFKKYMVFSKATLVEVSSHQILYLTDSVFPSLLSDYFHSVPTGSWASVSNAQSTATELPGNTYLLTLDTALASSIWKTLAPAVNLAGYRYWQKYLIEQGIAWVDGPISEAFTPHQINHQFIDAISFKKGCYTGQEVVARMHYKATPKAHLYAYELTAELSPQRGDAVKFEDQIVGKVLWLTQISDSQWRILAEIKKEFADLNVVLDIEKPEKLRQITLPYAINKVT